MATGRRGCSQEAPATGAARRRTSFGRHPRRSCSLSVYGDGRFGCSGRERGDESRNEANRRSSDFELRSSAPAVRPTLRLLLFDVIGLIGCCAIVASVPRLRLLESIPVEHIEDAGCYLAHSWGRLSHATTRKFPGSQVLASAAKPLC